MRGDEAARPGWYRMGGGPPYLWLLYDEGIFGRNAQILGSHRIGWIWQVRWPDGTFFSCRDRSPMAVAMAGAEESLAAAPPQLPISRVEQLAEQAANADVQLCLNELATLRRNRDVERNRMAWSAGVAARQSDQSVNASPFRASPGSLLDNCWRAGWMAEDHNLKEASRG